MSGTSNDDSDLLVMIIDDDPDDCFFHDRAVREAAPSAEVVTVHSAEDALLYLRGDSPVPDVVLLDINMPKKSGWDFLDELELVAPDGGVNTMIIMLTSSHAPRDLRRADEHPMVRHFTTKPLDHRRFSELLAARSPD